MDVKLSKMDELTHYNSAPTVLGVWVLIGFQLAIQMKITQP
jgi:hypothetical protein